MRVVQEQHSKKLEQHHDALVQYTLRDIRRTASLVVARTRQPRYHFQNPRAAQQAFQWELVRGLADASLCGTALS